MEHSSAKAAASRRTPNGPGFGDPIEGASDAPEPTFSRRGKARPPSLSCLLRGRQKVKSLGSKDPSYMNLHRGTCSSPP